MGRSETRTGFGWTLICWLTKYKVVLIKQRTEELLSSFSDA